MKLSAVKERLESQLPTGTQILVGLDELRTPIKKGVVVVPVSREASAPGEPDNIGGKRQSVVLTFGVVSIAPSSARGDRTLTELEDLSASVTRALIGWEPAEAWGAAYFVSASRPEYPIDDLPLAIWQDEFSVKIHMQGV